MEVKYARTLTENVLITENYATMGPLELGTQKGLRTKFFIGLNININ